MSRTVKLIVSGRVQGVFFRKSTKEKADQLGVKGTVRNLESCEVEVVAQADAAALERFIEWCRQGPLLARVDKVEITELTEVSYHFDRFDIT
jgi:acylphosphatase